MTTRAHKIVRWTAMAGLVVGGVLAWAALWPEESCADPVCAKRRFELFVELDSFKQINPPPLEVRTPHGFVSIESVFASGGIDVVVAVDQTEVPYAIAGGKLDTADLYQYARVWRSLPMPAEADAKVYALITTGLVSQTGENLFGLMFDVAGREALAVAPEVIARTFASNPETVPTLQLRTFAHELLHALNRRHLDAAQISDRRLTLEAPTKCISDTSAVPWSLREEPLFALSPQTIHFFQTATPAAVLPGRNNTPYELRPSSANECEMARANIVPEPAQSRLQMALRRLGSLFRIQEARAADTSDSEAAPPPDMALQIQAMPAAYPRGYPISIRIIATNFGGMPVPLKGRLLPGYGIVLIEYRRLYEEDWRVLRPLAWYESTDDEDSLLHEGERTEQTAAVFFGEKGWTFDEPGEYELRARLNFGADVAEVASDPIQIRIAEPATPDEQAALQLILADDGYLDEDIGRFIALGGGVTGEDAAGTVQAVASQHPETALGSAFKLPLASHLLRPPIDVSTGIRPDPDVDQALALLADTCTDSGISAQKSQLMQRHRESFAELDDEVEPSHIAWDGMSASSDEILTYVNDELSRIGPSIHFCLDDTSIKGAAAGEARELAEHLRDLDPERIIVVGHADSHGSCAHNDRLAMERAVAMKELLTLHRIPEERIQAVSLGKRRPLDFSTSEQARRLNRRVEVLVDAEAAAAQVDGEPQDENEDSIEDETQEQRPPAFPSCH